MAKQMRFKVLAGKHHHSDGKVYNKDDVFSADTDLTKRFKNKFVREQDFDAPVVTPEKGSSKAATAKAAAEDTDEEKNDTDEGDEGKDAALAARGKDVTEKFPVAVKNKYLVFARSKHYSVYESDEATPLSGCEGLEKNAVEAAIEKLLET